MLTVSKTEILSTLHIRVGIELSIEDIKHDCILFLINTQGKYTEANKRNINIFLILGNFGFIFYQASFSFILFKPSFFILGIKVVEYYSESKRSLKLV